MQKKKAPYLPKKQYNVNGCLVKPYKNYPSPVPGFCASGNVVTLAPGTHA